MAHTNSIVSAMGEIDDYWAFLRKTTTEALQRRVQLAHHRSPEALKQLSLLPQIQCGCRPVIGPERGM